MSSSASWFLPRTQPAALIPFVLGSASIASLLFYFYGVSAMGTGTRWLLLPSLVALIFFLLLAARRRQDELVDRALAGLWAGALATLAYDVVRVPISVSGVPVFKAISYFGTLILDQTTPTLASEVAGWGYHFSNGVGFGLMYAVALTRFRLWSALLWGVTLEIAMLLTPYAEVFGYRVSPKFLAVTIGSHLVYGVVLWAALRYWGRLPDKRRLLGRLVALALLAPLGIGVIAWDFHARHAATIPPSPPSYTGEHLYTTWNVLEPDRIAVLWVLRRYVDPEARFHFVEPFSHLRFGRPIDAPEAEVRRSGVRSATEVLLAAQGLLDDEKLRRLGEMTHLFEITRWRLPSEPEAFQLGQRLIDATGTCDPADVAPCVERGLRFLDAWYRE